MTRKLTLVPTPHLSAVSLEAAQQHLELLGNQPIALRVLGGQEANGRRIWPSEGYFDNAASAAHAATVLSQAGADALYCVLQPIDPGCLHRSVNAFGGKGTAAVADRDVVRYRFLLIDLDPERPTGISSTAEEMAFALERADAIAAHLHDLEWPDPLYVLGSGNGAHLVYRISLAKTPETIALLRRVLAALALRFDDARVHVDRKVYNPARITKLAGTWTRKGDSTHERPHRVAWLERHDAKTTAVRVGKLRALAGMYDAEKPRRLEGDELEGFVARLEERGLAPRVKTWNDATLIDLRCWRADHGHRSGYVVVREAAGEDPTDGAGGRRLQFFARCHAEQCDADTANLLTHLGLESETTKTDPDAVREIVAAVNATGITEL